MTRKASKPVQPNARDVLTSEFIEELQKDFAEHRTTVIETLRKESPSRYAELIVKLIPLEPRMVEKDSDKPKNSEDIGRYLLRDVGLSRAFRARDSGSGPML